MAGIAKEIDRWMEEHTRCRQFGLALVCGLSRANPCWPPGQLAQRCVPVSTSAALLQIQGQVVAMTIAPGKLLFRQIWSLDENHRYFTIAARTRTLKRTARMLPERLRSLVAPAHTREHSAGLQASCAARLGPGVGERVQLAGSPRPTGAQTRGPTPRSCRIRMRSLLR